MAFSDSTNPQNLTSLTREIATLTATLQRERQRRSAIAAHAKDVEHRADAAEMKLKQVQYANKKLEEELSQYKENEVQNRLVRFCAFKNHVYTGNLQMFAH